MRQARVRSVFRALRELGPDLAGLQEIFLWRYYVAVRAVFSGGFHWHIPWGSAGVGVIYADKRFKYRGKGRRRLHGKIPGVSSARDLRFVTLTDRRSGLPIAHASAHLTPSAWSRRLDSNPDLKRRTREAWLEGAAVIVKWLEDSTRNGFVAVLTLDANADHARFCEHLPRRIAGQRVHVLSNGVDHIVLIGAWSIMRHRAIRTASDHEIYYVDAEPAAAVKLGRRAA